MVIDTPVRGTFARTVEAMRRDLWGRRSRWEETILEA